MPWVLVGDFNLSPTELQRSQFVQRISGIVRVAPGIEGTCSLKKGPDSMLDYLVMSESAIPCVKSVSAVKSVPWKPQCGLVVSFRRSALQLTTRVLEMPRRLPQCPRPKVEPTPGSKSSLSKAKLVQARSEARDKRAKRIRDLFGEHLGEGEGSSRPCPALESDGAATGALDPHDPAEDEDVEELYLGFEEEEEDPWREELSFGPAGSCAKPSATPPAAQGDPRPTVPAEERGVDMQDGPLQASTDIEPPIKAVPPHTLSRVSDYNASNNATELGRDRAQPPVGFTNAPGQSHPTISFAVPDEVWYEARNKVGFTPGSYPVSAVSHHLTSSVAFSLEPASCTTISGMYASWAEAAELAILNHHEVDRPAGNPSRAAGPQFVVRKMRHTLHTSISPS